MSSFSIIIPSYNYGHYISAAIDSVIPQMQDQDELIIVDDGSTDDTREIVSTYIEKYPNKIKYYFQSNQGLGKTRNVGIGLARKEYFIFLDADDELLENALKTFRDFLLEHEEIDAVFSGHISREPSGKMRTYLLKYQISGNREKTFIDYLRKQFSIVNGACALHRRIFETLKYPSEMQRSEDIPVFSQILALFRCGFFELPTIIINKHPDSLRHRVVNDQGKYFLVVDTIFNSQVLPKSFFKYRREYYAIRCLSLFRTFYLSGDFEGAKQFYKEGIKTYPLMLFKWSYLRKFLRMYLTKIPQST